MLSSDCPVCNGKRLKRESLSVKFAGYDIAEISALPLAQIYELILPFAKGDIKKILRTPKRPW
ncbi:hypothetical protein MKQ70_13775 [Chitinophaga sedimenti]|uniref:hypothetical protein n=1 Tax=Chitinophaga sedimenti TaxID=2033606 RepID=UPI002006AAB0|nr:hypothetical protein [Chitinophaga sedimenti]MCK7556031.1 hypothetical protein [Chitinophaga sedimenti]